MIPVLDPSPVPNRCSFGPSGADGMVSGADWHAVSAKPNTTPTHVRHLFMNASSLNGLIGTHRFRNASTTTETQQRLFGKLASILRLGYTPPKQQE